MDFSPPLPVKPPNTLTRKFRGAAQGLAFVYVIALLSQVVSERMFWYWDTSPLVHLEGALFYALPVAACLWMMSRHGVASWPGVVLASTIYAYVTEGVITPVLYSGGPFVPFFPVWFTAWHGLMAFGLFAFGIRALLLQGRWKVLLAVSAAFGGFWGTWLSTSSLPDVLEDADLIELHGGPLQVLSIEQFSIYVVTFTLVAIACHVVLGWLWPASFRIGRAAKMLIGGFCLLSAGMWSVAYLWALPMFVGLVWLTDRLLRDRGSAEPSLLDRLHGRVPWLATWPLLAMIPAAIGTYAAITTADPSDGFLTAIFYGTIAVQTLAAAVLLVWSTRRVRRSVRDHGVGATPAVLVEPVAG